MILTGSVGVRTVSVISVLASSCDTGIIRNDFHSFFVGSSSIKPSSTESVVQGKYDTLNPLLFL